VGEGVQIGYSKIFRGMQPKEFLDWVVAVEEILNFKRVPEDRRVSLVAIKFWVELCDVQN
jgi:hypothetical protein